MPVTVLPSPTSSERNWPCVRFGDPVAVHHLLHQILLELKRRAPTLRVVQQLVPTRLPVRCGLRSSRVALTHDAAQLRLDVLERARVVDHKRQLLGRGRLQRPRRKRREAQQRAVDDPVPALGLELLLVRAALQPRHGHAEGRVLRGDHREEAREHVAGHEALRLRHAAMALTSFSRHRRTSRSRRLACPRPPTPAGACSRAAPSGWAHPRPPVRRRRR